MKKSKLITTFIVLSLFISTIFANTVKAIGPKVLENYKEHHDKLYKEKLISIENYDATEIKTLEKFLKDSIDKCDFSANIRMESIESIIEEDRIISSVEMFWDISTYSPYDENLLTRRWATPEIFNINIDKLEKKDYEKYGYLTCKNKESKNFKNMAKNMSDYYGNIIINFKKSNLIGRTTLTIGDSLNNRRKLGKNTVTPTMASDPKFVCVPGHFKELINLLSSAINEKKLLPENPDLISKIEFTPSNKPNSQIDLQYFELQFHGDLSFKNDVESVDIIITKSQSNEDISKQKEIKKRISDLGIKVNFIDCRQVS